MFRDAQQLPGGEGPSPAPVVSAARAAAAEHLAYLDGWRGLAILAVLVGHFVAAAPGRLAGTGVELFFVLSGRLMADLLIVRRHPLPGFLFRRASRLVPGLLFYIAVALLILAVASPAFGSLDEGLIGAAAGMGFVHNYLPAGSVVSLYEHFWSLAVEEHSYLLLAAITLVAVRDRRTAMVVAALLALAAILNGWLATPGAAPGGQYAYWRTDVRAASIFMSFAIYLWAEARFRTARSAQWTWLSPASLALGLAVLLHPAIPDPVRFTFGTALLALSVNSLDRAPAPFRAAFELPVLTMLGLVSYSLYLWQQPFFLLSQGGALPAIVSVALALGCAILSFRTIERPARRVLNGFWDARREMRAVRVESA